MGVYFDPTLSFQEHVSTVRRSCYLELRRISSVRHYLSEDATHTLVRTLILSKLDYCNSLLAGCPKYLLSDLQKVQNSAARLIFKAKRTEHVTPLLDSLHWLPVEKRIEYKLSLLCFKCITMKSAPVYLSDLLQLYTPSRDLRSSADARLLRRPFARTKSFGERAFCYQAPVVWNQLPHSVRHAPSLESFKSSLKTFLFLRQP